MYGTCVIIGHLSVLIHRLILTALFLQRNVSGSSVFTVEGCVYAGCMHKRTLHDYYYRRLGELGFNEA